ncbi:FAD-binding oxidoreductase [Neorhizobium sp. NCHU2750]|uniref:NAD(P)/FAD-dependent oxidoreductase n=1 Tax=Neorhizobium sp. NCHU2750 TaxID=1825976 RepID=UPI001FDF4413
MGLWAAVKAERLGMSTVLVEAGRLGEGASGGLLGALMPHMPDKWNDKKQFQFDALLSLEDEVAAIEAQTGLSCGYRRSGRLIPLPKPHLRVIAARHNEDASIHWRQAGESEVDGGETGTRRFRWDVLDQSPYAGWPDASFLEAGLVHDTFAARVSPRKLTAALAALLRGAKHVAIAENCEVSRIDAAAGRVEFSHGGSMGFSRCIVSAGHRAFPLIEAFSKPLLQPLGQPVKGQAALLRAGMDPGLPLLYLNGLYLVPHDNGDVALGSTSEDAFDDPFSTDGQLDDLVERARALVPALAGVPVVERWAGLRPKAIDRDPMVGPHPDHANVIALGGGFKVSFGVAHLLADAALEAVLGRAMGVPPSFSLVNHMSVASR